ncbi:MAG: M56 family metallopeptidase, partial [Actinomycetota bacterium]|nr:M56 family metallopeptidase [Actinomycetota bacterium]
VSVPPPLARALARTGVSGAHCVDGTDAVAFCAGVAHPRVYVTTGLIAALGPDALDAVLVHEATHARRRDPARRLAHRAFADVFFYLPVITCWSRRQIERAELHADQVAITHTGRGALAQALLATGSSTTSAPGAGFDGALDARIAQLLGDDPPRRPLSPWHWLLSLAGLITAVSLMMCLGQAAAAAL